MKAIHLVDIDKTVITFNKSGSTLFTNTLKLFLNWRGIEINGEYPKTGEVIALTRNPIQRFFSGFLHSHSVPKGVHWDFVERGDIIRRMEKWVEKSISGELREDWHYVRQGEILDEIGILNKTYRIEDIGDELVRMGTLLYQSQNPDWSSTKPIIQKGELELFTDLDIPMGEWDWQILCGFYYQILMNLNGGHHRGKETNSLRHIIQNQRPDLMNRIREWLKEDLTKYGYGEAPMWGDELQTI